MAMSLGVLGPAGTHSEAAAVYLKRQTGEDYKLVLFADIFDCLQAVENGEVASALVPVENSLEGAINITLDTLARSEGLTVWRELIWPVHNQLLARRQGEIKRIYSHAQPISQCRDFLLQNYPQAELIKVASTARAAEIVAEAPADSGSAAIATARAGELLGLVPIATEIQDSAANCTRFFQVGRQALSFLPKEKLLVICQIDGQKAGALFEVLKEFAQRGINMTRIESRPARTELGAYIFFFDLEYSDSPQLEEALSAVEKKSIWLRNLGTFPVLTVN
ncbi:MAG: prephenate dehydratase [Selenomonas ruminantium]|jgi:prephenate dehydratase|uniref:Prephenate dehydratase n=1 Tax=Selenomonas ruminantium TaxID=971 RepID=A0A927ZQQ6_SELRU|nr:prephenate dehydratase [Selenomonas ruminantium]MBE6085409.1 prephenate dehydratase [Selenomonas ruminantium]